MKAEELVENIKLQIVEMLNETFSQNLTLGQLTNVSDLIENLILFHIEEQLISNAHHYIKDGEKSNQERCVSYKGHDYSVIAMPEILRFEEINIAIIPKTYSISKRQFKKKKHTIKTVGRFQVINATVPPIVPINIESFIIIASTIIEIVYAWFVSIFRSVISREQISLSYDLYSYIRVVFSQDDLWKMIWLGGVVDGVAIYLLDSDLADSTIERFRNKEKNFGESRIKMLAEFLSWHLPLEETNASIALKENCTYDYEILESGYAEEHKLTTLLEKEVFQAEVLSTYPIVSGKSNSNMLVAWFPTELKGVIEPVMEMHKKHLRKRFTRAQSKLYLILRSLNECSVLHDDRLVASFGRFFGGFVRSFVE